MERLLIREVDDSEKEKNGSRCLMYFSRWFIFVGDFFVKFVVLICL